MALYLLHERFDDYGFAYAAIRAISLGAMYITITLWIKKLSPPNLDRNNGLRVDFRRSSLLHSVQIVPGTFLRPVIGLTPGTQQRLPAAVVTGITGWIPAIKWKILGGRRRVRTADRWCVNCRFCVNGFSWPLTPIPQNCSSTGAHYARWRTPLHASSCGYSPFLRTGCGPDGPVHTRMPSHVAKVVT